MSLKKKFAAKETTELVQMLETVGGYTEEAIQVIDEELRYRNIPLVKLKGLAKDFVQQRAKAEMDRLDPLNDELKIPESYFLKKKELKEIYLKELSAVMKEREGFRFDVWQYAIGGI